MSSIINKVKEAVTRDKHDKYSDSTNAGPHDSNLANKADPRVDSGLDGRAAHTTHGGVNTGMNTGATTTTTTGNTYGTTTGSTNAGPHTSNLANKMDPRVDSDLDGRAATHSTAGYSGMNTGATTMGNTYGTTGSTNAGPHNSNLANKMDHRVDSDLDGRATHHTGHTTAGTTTGTTTTATGAYGSSTGSANNGPHSSKLMNKLDPRVDSDRDGRNVGSVGSADTTTKSFEQSQTESTPTSTTAHGVGSANHGPHNSNILNKMDPRVDSDGDHRAGYTGTTGHSHATGPTMAAGAGGMGAGAMGSAATGHHHHSHHHGHHHGHGAPVGTTTTGVHSSHVANEMDPRVDSNAAYGITNTGRDFNTRSTNAGPHDSNLANKMDPRVDSDMDNRASHVHAGTMNTTSAVPAGSSYASTGTTSTQGDVGPHKSNLMNKLDPRVDSDLDGSRTVGTSQRQY